MRRAVGNTPTSSWGSKRIFHFCVPLLCPLLVWIQIISCSDKRTKGNENKIFMYLIVFAISISYDVELISSMVYVIFHSLLSGMKRTWNKRPISNVSDADLLNKRNPPMQTLELQCTITWTLSILKELCHKFYQNSDRRNCQQMSET